MLDFADGLPTISAMFAVQERRRMIQVIVISPNILSGACMVAGLAGLTDMQTDICNDPAHYVGTIPDIVLLQVPGEPIDPRWLAGLLAELPRRWPTTLMMVVTDDLARSIPVCLASGVRACLSSLATIDQLAAAILLVGGNMFVYEGKAAALDLPPGDGPPPVAQVAEYVVGVVGRGIVGRGVAAGNGATAD